MPTTGEIVGTEKKLEENKMFKKLKDKKGFTLVELIVVLVILAILAALLVPALTGYIDKARNEAIIAETRSAVVAAQTIVSEDYGQGVKIDATYNADADGKIKGEIKDLAEVAGTVVSFEAYTEADTSDDSIVAGKIKALTYQDKNGKKQCVYTYNSNGTDLYVVSDVKAAGGKGE